MEQRWRFCLFECMRRRVEIRNAVQRFGLLGVLASEISIWASLYIFLFLCLFDLLGNIGRVRGRV